MTDFSTLSGSGAIASGDKLVLARPNTVGFDPLQLDPQQLIDYVNTSAGFLGSFSKWNAAKARGASSPARVLFAGDSTVDGHGDNGGTDLFTNGFARQFAVNRGWLTGSIYGQQHIGLIGTYESYNPKLSHTGANVGVDGSESHILGGKFFRNATGASATFTWAPDETFDTLVFVYPTVSGNDGTVTVKVDGTTVGTETQNVASSMQVKTYTGLAHTTHTVTVDFSGSGDGYWMALEIQDRTLGTPVYCQAAYSGGLAADYNVTSNPWSAINQLGAQDFDYCLYCMTINDINAPTGEDTYYTNVEAFVKVAAETADGCLMTGFPANTAAQTQGRMLTYAENLKAIAKDFGWSFFDTRAMLGHSYVAANAKGYAYDNLHPNASGHDAVEAGLSVLLGSSL